MSGKSRVIMEMTGDESKLVASYRKAITENRRFKDEMRDLARQGRQSTNWATDAQRSFQRAFSPANVMGMAAALTGVGGVGAAITKVVSLASAARDEVKGFAEELKETYSVGRQLWQLSENRSAFAALTHKQQLAMHQEGLTREEAGDLVFNLKSLGKEDATMAIAKAERFMSAKTAGEYFTTMTATANYGDAAGSAEQVLGGLLEAAAQSRFNTDQTADWTIRATPALAAIGTGQAEMLAIGGGLSTSVPNPETLSTRLMAGATKVEKWKAEALLKGEEVTAAPEAPEKPKYEPPEWKPEKYTSLSSAISAKASFDERLAEYDKRHAEKMEDYNVKRAEYETEYSAWDSREKREKQVADAIRDKRGLLELFQAMRQYDPEGYEEGKRNEKQFNRFAVAMEKAESKIVGLIPVIDDALKTAAPYEQKISERPPELSLEQKRRVAIAQNKIASEDEQHAEWLLEAQIAQAKTLSRYTGGSPIATEAWTQALDSGATANIDWANDVATRGLVKQLYHRRPELFQKYLGEHVEVEKDWISPSSFGGRPIEVTKLDLDTITPAIVEGVTDAINELSRANIDQRYEAAAGVPPVSPTPGDSTEVVDELAGVNGKLDELIEVTKAGQRGAAGELPTTPEPGGHGY